MDALISSLLEITTSVLHLYYEGSDNEGNVCTKSQVAAAKAKGWIPRYTVDDMNWLEYEGVDDEVDGITLPGLENGSVPVYNMAGQKVTSPVRGGIYVVGGKKVVVK